MENIQTMETTEITKLTKTGKIRKATNEKREKFFVVVRLQGDVNEDKQELINLWARNSGFLVYSLNLLWNQDTDRVEAYEVKSDTSFVSHPTMPLSLRKSGITNKRNIADALSLYLETHWDNIESSELTVKQYFRRFKTV